VGRPALTRLVALVGSMLLLACNGFDNDEKFVPKYRFSLVLVQQADGKTILYQASESGIFPYDYGQPPLADSITDLAWHEDYLYLAVPNQRLVRRINLKEQRETARYSLYATSVTDGEKGVLAAGAGGAQFIEYRRDRQTNIGLTVGRYQKGIYAAQRFYVLNEQADGWHLAVVNEKALTEERSPLLANFPVDIQLSRAFNPTVLQQAPDRYLRQEMSANSRELSAPVAVDYQHFALSSLLKDPYETAFLADLFVVNGRLRQDQVPLSIPDSVYSLALDSWGSRLVYTARDSLKLYDLKASRYLSAAPAPGHILKAIHYYNY
jgi:hypothetical protein